MSHPGWRWVTQDVVLAIHDEQIAEHGGGVGVRDMALVQSALGRPRNLAAYGNPDFADLAASYAFGIARNHGFVDGNKRTAFVMAYVFLLDHSYELTASDVEAVRVMVSLAAGEIEEVELAGWFRESVRPIVSQ
jgi:death on curing protein